MIAPYVRVDSPTEECNPRTAELDRLDSLGVLRLINAEDRTVADAVAACLPELAEVVDRAVVALAAGGTIHYFGAGTPGRLAVLDAAELRPTFALESGRVVAHIAGGDEALTYPVEGAEDDRDQGRADAADVRAGDVVIGVTASGRTPYVHGALVAAGEAGATAVLLSANPAAPAADAADVHLAVVTGPEALTGSTRMKAGTAQKLVLNAFSTAVMVRLGKTHGNLMVDVRATNAKLQGRTLTILMQATGADEATARSRLEAADADLKTALVTLLADVDPPAARAALACADGRVRAALDHLRAT